ncbi:MAG: hypothetical protein HLUCCO16_05890 [Phormidium sp. OSCR]|nr:MAG: hypothetical protein HLUCCO16_05890 [Phormidium sp. OSCR]
MEFVMEFVMGFIIILKQTGVMVFDPCLLK